MTEEFQEITVEVGTPAVTDTNWLNITWTDITADVMQDPKPKGEFGIMDNGFLDRVADSGSFTFCLDNSAANSQSTLGYYSSGAGFGLIGVGTMCRVGFKYANRKRYKFLGFREPGGYEVKAGIHGPRYVKVTYMDWFGLASNFPLDFIDHATSKRIDEAVPLVISSLPAVIQPTNTVYNTGDYTFPDVFDLMKGETSAMGEFNKLAISEFGLIYGRGNEQDGFTLVVENKLKRNTVSSDTSIIKPDSSTTDKLLLANGTDFLLLANGTDIFLLVETQTISFDDSDIDATRAKFSREHLFADYFKISTTPRKVDAAATTILWTMEQPILIEAGTTLSSLRARYRDPSGGASYVNGIEMVTPVATTDYRAFANEDGTGTEYTSSCSVSVEFGTAEAEFSITNSGANDFYVGGREGSAKFQFRGKGVYTYDSTDIIIDNTIATAGRKPFTFSVPYLTDPVELKRVLVLSILKDSTNSLLTCEAYPLFANRDKNNMYAFLYLEPGARATFSETVTGFNEECFINGYKFEIEQMKYVNWEPVLFRYDMVPDS